MMKYTTEINNLLKIRNELNIIKHIFYTDHHCKLAPKLAVSLFRKRKPSKPAEQMTSQEALLFLKRHVHDAEERGEESDDVIENLRVDISRYLIKHYLLYKKREVVSFNDFSAAGSNQPSNSKFYSVLDTPHVRNKHNL